MVFVFEKRKGPGKYHGSQPDHAAVRITRHKEGNGSKRSGVRLYVAFSPEAVKAARWIGGDKIAIGYDVENMMLCFRRDQHNGYTIAGGGLTKGKGNASFQLSTAEGSDLWRLVEPKLGAWIDVTDDGPMLIASLE